MCGRYVSASSPQVYESYLSVDEVKAEELPPRWNVAPTDPVLAVVEREERRRMGTLQWGLIPWFSKDAGGGARMINARAEGIATKPAFRRAFERRRCLLPADGFYEWERRDPDGGGKPIRQPYLFRHADGTPLVFAGLWETWRDPGAGEDAEPVRTCTIITTAANDLVARIHDRMPVVLPPERWDEWLDPTNHATDALAALLVPEVADALVMHPVSRAVNSVRNDGPHLVEPVELPA